MKIAILHAPRDLRIEEQTVAADNLRGDEIHVETRISAFKIGTDRGNYEGAEQVPGAPDYPRSVGDSNLGIVRAVGSDVTRFRTGDRVVGIMPHQSEYVVAESGYVVKVPDGVHDEDAVYAWLYALSSLCFRKAFFQPGEYVAVVGLGVLGLGAVALGRFLGARIIAIGNSAVRLEMADRMGAQLSCLSDDPDLRGKLDKVTRGAGIDLVIQTANPWSAYRTSVEIVRPDGRVAIVALPGRGESPLDFNPLDMKWFYQKGISLIAVSGQTGHLYPNRSARFDRCRECEYILDLMADGGLEPKRLITHRFHYSEMTEAYEMAYRREKNMLGVIFQWNEPS
ncbi:MAG: zinc-binding dehydrogenase [Fuerstiella sp.]|nr:zinc-binding dehydrogenase [Fuerstiella sp.]